MNIKSKFVKTFKRIPTPVLVGIVVAIAVIRLIYFFSLRNGHHVDEVWSYGFANSYYAPHLYGDYDGIGIQNIGEWITGDTFNDYITVSDDHRFSFDSVLYNKQVDLSPPLYELILHFVCSLFPGSFSWWFAFSISLFAYIPSLVLVYLISYEFTESRFCGLLTVIYYVFSGCGTANFIFLRIYHLVTFFALALFWLIVKILKNTDKRKLIYYFLLFIPALLGYLTHYYFLVIAFLFTFFGAIALLLKKRIRDSFRLCYFMLLSVVLFFVIYSPALYRLLPYSSGDTSGTGYYSYPYYFDLAVANIRFFTGTIGFAVNFNIPDLLAFGGIVVFAVIFLALFCFLFRNELWLKKAVKNACAFIAAFMKQAIGILKKMDCSIWVALCSCVGYLLIIPYSATLTNMGFTERYFFSAMTLFVVVYMSFVGMVLNKLFFSIGHKKIHIITASALSVLIVVLNFFSNSYTNMFKFDYMNDRELSEQLIGDDCYAVISSARDLIWLAPVLCESGDVYVEYQSVFNDENYTPPEFESDYDLFIVEYGLMTEEQKEDLASRSNFGMYGNVIPLALMTADDVVQLIGKQSKSDYNYLGEYASFIGNVRLYKIVKK